LGLRFDFILAGLVIFILYCKNHRLVFPDSLGFGVFKRDPLDLADNFLFDFRTDNLAAAGAGKTKVFKVLVVKYH